VATRSREGPDNPGLVAWLWVDAQLPPSIALWFRVDLRIEAVHVADLDLLTAKDEVIFRAARTADRAVVLVTKDDDFRQLIDRHGPPPQVIWVRCGNVTNSELRRILLDAWPRVAALLASGEPLVELRRRDPGQATGA
jgi:predicted nuclease of predicted toxin-antitoxin system